MYQPQANRKKLPTFFWRSFVAGLFRCPKESTPGVVVGQSAVVVEGHMHSNSSGVVLSGQCAKLCVDQLQAKRQSVKND